MHAIVPVLAAAVLASGAVSVLADHRFVRTKDLPQTHFEGTILAEVVVRPGFWGPPGGGHPHPFSGPATVRPMHDDDHPQPPPGPTPSPHPDPQPNPPPNVWHPPIVVTRPVNVELHIQGGAPLRLGEIESFRVETYHSYPSPVIEVVLVVERAVWEYHGSGREEVPVGPIYPFARPGVATVRPLDHNHGRAIFRIVPVRRRPITPLNLISAIRIGTGGADAPLVVEFDDPGVTDDGGAQTVYGIELKRTRTLWFAKTIAKGEVPGQAGVQQRIVVEKGGPLHTARNEWLKDGTKYRVEIRVRKISPEYDDDFSDSQQVEFKYRAGSRTFSRATVRAARFELVHEGETASRAARAIGR